MKMFLKKKEVFALEAEQTCDPEIVNQESELINDLNDDQIPGNMANQYKISLNQSRNNSSYQKILLPCVKIMDRSLGAPQTTYVTESGKETKLILELSANSVLFMSNVIQCHIRKQRFSSKY